MTDPFVKLATHGIREQTSCIHEMSREIKVKSPDAWKVVLPQCKGNRGGILIAGVIGLTLGLTLALEFLRRRSLQLLSYGKRVLFAPFQK